MGAAPERRAAAAALERAGFSVEESEPPRGAEAPRRRAPDVVLLVGASPEGVRALRSGGELGGAALLAIGPDGDSGALREAGADDVVGDGAEVLAARVDQALRLQRAGERLALGRLRMQALSDFGELILSSPPLENLLPSALRRISDGFGDGFSAVLAEAAPGGGGLRLWSAPEDPRGGRTGDASRCEAILRALDARAPLLVGGAPGDLLAAEIQSLVQPPDTGLLWLQPLPIRGAPMAALLAAAPADSDDRAFGPEERLFAAACAGALAAGLTASRLSAGARREREVMASAYAERRRELASANLRLKEANRLKDETLALCSHDLRGPLNILLGHARLLAEAELDADESASTKAILRQGKRLFELVESQLDRGRGERAGQELKAEPLELGEVCREQTALQEPLAAERGVRIELRVSALALCTDAAMLRRVLQILIRRAVGRARDGGSVVVQVEGREGPERPVARVAIADDGAALPPDELLTLFERYRKGPIDPELALCRDQVELLGGEIWAESGPGGAAVFTLPLAGAQLSG